MSIDIKFENGIGVIEEDAFNEFVPEGLSLDDFTRMDEARDEFTAAVGNAMLDEVESGSGDEDLSVVGYSVGGNAVLNIDVNKDNGLTSSIVVSCNSLVTEMLERADTIYRIDGDVEAAAEEEDED